MKKTITQSFKRLFLTGTLLLAGLASTFAQDLNVSTFAGGNVSSDGVLTDAQFYGPRGMAFDPIRNVVYTTDVITSIIRQIDISTGVVTTIAGTGQRGFKNGVGTAAQFNAPYALALYKDTLYISDNGNCVIRKMSLTTKEVSVLAGKDCDDNTSTDGIGRLATIRNPWGLTTDATGFLYTIDNQGKIRRIDLASAQVTTLDTGGFSISPVKPITFNTVNSAITTDNQGNLYITEYNNSNIYKIVIATGAFTKLSSSFDSPSSLTYDNKDTVLYVTSYNQHTIRTLKIKNRVNTLFAGSTTGTSGYVNGIGTVARFNSPTSTVIISPTQMIIADYNNNRIRSATLSTKAISLFAGGGNLNNAIGALARFNSPQGIAGDASGNLYVADSKNHVIRKVTPSGDVSTFAGVGLSGYTNGAATIAKFNGPSDVVIKGDSLYVVDQGNHCIRVVKLSTGQVDLFVGKAQNSGYLNGIGVIAQFNSPTTAVIVKDTMFVVDANNRRIRKVNLPSKEVFLASGTGGNGNTNGNTLSATYSSPYGIEADSNAIYITDPGSARIRKIDRKTNVVSNFAGNGGGGYKDDVVGTNSSFENSMREIAFDGNNGLLVADTRSAKIRRISLSGTNSVTTFAGGNPAKVNGTIAISRFASPVAFYVDLLNKNIFISEADNFIGQDGIANNDIRKISITANTAPSFTKGLDTSINTSATTTMTISNWATAISKGSQAFESAQLVTFVVKTNADSLFTVIPTISATGTLVIKPALDAEGVATVSVYVKDNGGLAYGGIDSSAVQTFKISVSKTVALEDIEELKGLKVYPNPSNGNFVVSVAEAGVSGTVAVSVKNLLGEDVYHSVSSKAETSITLNKPAGIYVATILTNKGSKTIKLVVE